MNLMAAVIGLGLALALGAAAGAADAPKAPHIVVVGNGEVSTPPQIAELTFSVRGEGANPDAATTDLVRKRAAIEGGLAGLSLAKLQVTTGEMTIQEVRGSACDQARNDGAARLSVGDCAVQGFVASLGMTARLEPPAQAGTAAGLASRLGASDTHVSEFKLRTPAEAQHRAVVAAFQDARVRAEAIAAASGVHLGPLLSVADQDTGIAAEDIVVTGERLQPRAAPPAPIAMSLTPQPIKTEAHLTVTYGLAP